MKLELLKKSELVALVKEKDEELKELIKQLNEKLEEKDLKIKSLTSQLEAAKKDCLGTQKALEEVKNQLNDLRDEYDAMTATSVELSNKLLHSHFLNIVLGISFVVALICAIAI